MKAPGTERSRQTPDPESQAWHQLPWQAFEQHVLRMQKHIYQASQHGDKLAVHSQQQLLMESEAARLLAVHHVTQDNDGKDTAGIDGVKSVPHRSHGVGFRHSPRPLAAAASQARSTRVDPQARNSRTASARHPVDARSL